MKEFKTYVCMVCLQDVTRLTDQELSPIYMCDVCYQTSLYSKTILVKLDGAPAGGIRGSRNPVKNCGDSVSAWQGNEPESRALPGDLSNKYFESYTAAEDNAGLKMPKSRKDIEGSSKARE